MRKQGVVNIREIDPPMNSWLLAVVVGMLLLVVVFVLWWTLTDREHLSLERKVIAESRNMASYIDADFRGRIPALRRMVRRWELNPTPRSEFEDDANAYIVDIPGFQAIEWVDDTYHVRWIVPLAGNEKAVGLNLASEPARLLALEKAKVRRGPSMTSPIDLVQGGKGFLIYLPIYTKGEFQGFIIAVFHIERWLEYVFSLREDRQELEEYRVSVRMDEVPVYEQEGWDRFAGSSLAVETDFKFMGRTFSVKVVPSDIFLSRNQTSIPVVSTVAGIMLSLLIAVLVYLYQRTAVAVWRGELAKAELEAEIEERGRTEKELQDATARLGLATRAGRIGVWTWEVTDNQLFWDSRMFDLYDVPSDAKVVFDTWRNAVHPDDVDAAQDLIRKAAEGKAAFDTEFRIVRSDGEVRFIKAAARVERDETGQALRMTGVNWDVTDQKRAEEKILHMANHDALTGLPSLRLAKDRLASALGMARRKKTRSAVLFVDLDGFKAVNDQYGHDAGDALLVDVARRLEVNLRETDTVARIGGDEFLVVANELAKPGDAASIAQNLVDSVSEPFFWEGNKLRVGASVGISLFPENGDHPDELIKSADQAMYNVKKSGKNDFAFAGEAVE